MDEHLEHFALGGIIPADTHRIDLGPTHPGMASLLTMKATLVNGHLRRPMLYPGAGHRGDEKLFEARDYRALLMLASRHQWHSPADAELGAAMAIEALLGLEPPPRAVAIRTLLAELARIASHLASLTFVAWHQNSPVLNEIESAREGLRVLTWRLTGNRVHPMAVRVGGVSADVDDAWCDSALSKYESLVIIAERLNDLVDGFGVGHDLAPIPSTLVDEFGLSGPVAKAAGFVRDARINPGYGAYSLPGIRAILCEVPARSNDASGRFAVLADEISTSAAVSRALIDLLATLDGPITVKLSKVIKAPDGEIITSTAAPWGESQWHISSRADRTPWRVRLRTPGFANLQATERLLDGVAADHIATVIASMGYASGDVDK